MDLNCRFLFKVIPWNIQPRPVLPVVGVWMKLLVTFGLLTQEQCLQKAGIGNLASTAALIGDLTLRAKVQKITVCSKLGLETLHQEQQLVTSRLLLLPSIFKSPFRCNVKECNPIQREYPMQCNAMHCIRRSIYVEKLQRGLGDASDIGRRQTRVWGIVFIFLQLWMKMNGLHWLGDLIHTTLKRSFENHDAVT